MLQGFIAAEHVNLERIELEVPANESHGFNDVARPHGRHPGHHGHSHVGFKIPDQDHTDVTENFDTSEGDEYYYYYDGEIPDWAKEYYAEYEDELEEKIEQTRFQDENYFERQHEQNRDEHVHGALDDSDKSQDGKNKVTNITNIHCFVFQKT